MERFKANRKSLNRQNQQITLKPVQTSGRFKVTLSIVITMNLEFNSTCRRKKHSLFTLKHIDVARSIHTDLDVLQEKKIDDYWNVVSCESLSDFLERFHTIQSIEREASKMNTCGSVGRLTKIQTD